MAKTIKLNPEEDNFAQAAQQKIEGIREPAKNGANPDDAFEAFMKKWYTLDVNQKVNMLLDMIMNAGMKLDMLAASIYSEPAMKKHLDSISKENKPNMKGESHGATGNEGSTHKPK